MKLDKKERQFLLMNKGQIIPILNKYLDELKNAIWKEKDTERKTALSAVADEVEGGIIQINNIKLDEKEKETFTGI